MAPHSHAGVDADRRAALVELVLDQSGHSGGRPGHGHWAALPHPLEGDSATLRRLRALDERIGTTRGQELAPLHALCKERRELAEALARELAATAGNVPVAEARQRLALERIEAEQERLRELRARLLEQPARLVDVPRLEHECDVALFAHARVGGGGQWSAFECPLATRLRQELAELVDAVLQCCVVCAVGSVRVHDAQREQRAHDVASAVLAPITTARFLRTDPQLSWCENAQRHFEHRMDELRRQAWAVAGSWRAGLDEQRAQAQWDRELAARLGAVRSAAELQERDWRDVLSMLDAVATHHAQPPEHAGEVDLYEGLRAVAARPEVAAAMEALKAALLSEDAPDGGEGAPSGAVDLCFASASRAVAPLLCLVTGGTQAAVRKREQQLGPLLRSAPPEQFTQAFVLSREAGPGRAPLLAALERTHCAPETRAVLRAVLPPLFGGWNAQLGGVPGGALRDPDLHVPLVLLNAATALHDGACILRPLHVPAQLLLSVVDAARVAVCGLAAQLAARPKGGAGGPVRAPAAPAAPVSAVMQAATVTLSELAHKLYDAQRSPGPRFALSERANSEWRRLTSVVDERQAMLKQLVRRLAREAGFTTRARGDRPAPAEEDGARPLLVAVRHSSELRLLDVHEAVVVLATDGGPPDTATRTVVRRVAMGLVEQLRMASTTQRTLKRVLGI
jgi:hypothetical protein